MTTTRVRPTRDTARAYITSDSPSIWIVCDHDTPRQQAARFLLNEDIYEGRILSTAGAIFLTGSSAKERAMGSKRPARREFLKSGVALAGGFTFGAEAAAIGQTPASPKMIKGDKDQIAYGDRSRFVTSVRIAHPVGGRPSPDAFGLVFHVASPIQDSVGVITPSSLHFVGTTRGSYIPDIDPREHRLMIHGMVDRPLTFTVEDLKRLPSVTRLHFIECAGNRSSRRANTPPETHALTSCAEWTGVLLSVLLKECGLKSG